MSNRFKPGVFTRAALAGVLAAGLIPCAAFAAGGGAGAETDGSDSSSFFTQAAENQSRMFEEFAESGDSSALYSTEGLGDGLDATLSSAYLPEKLDLRDLGVVTPVKSQDPWGTCWGFSAIAIAETSILSELGATYEETGLDLSELQLAWFALTPLPEGSGAQAGEGNVSLLGGSNRLDTGGSLMLATAAFGSGIGPVSESLVPYRNKEGIIATYRDYLTPEEIEARKQQDPNFDPDMKMCWSADGDWSVDEQYRFGTTFELENSNRLPSPASWTYDSEGKVTYRYNEAGTAAIKSELAKGRAVSIGFSADSAMPNSSAGDEKYINTSTWAHYTYEKTPANHAVTIVGWDDTYSKDNFLKDHQPEHDGAWIVKNSWGSSAEEFPNNGGGWGVDGEGYFYLSYYDQSIATPETLDFDVESSSSDEDYFIIDSHSYLPPTAIDNELSDDEMRMANIFTAEEDQTVRALTTQTGSANTSVEARVYLLNDGATTPTDGKLVACASQAFEYAGFHRIDLTSGVTVKAGQRYSVVMTQRTSSGRYQTVISEGFTKEGIDYYKETLNSYISTCSNGVVNRGESMLYSDGEWVDWVDGVQRLKDELADLVIKKYGDSDKYDLRNLYTFDNFMIKAYADAYTAPVFSDVAESDWFSGAVSKVADAGLMSGYAGTDEFGVGHALTRAELATILWRDANPADAEAYDGVAANATGMDDVAADSFYTAAANWAVANGVIDGVEAADGSRAFEPDRAVTFEEAVAMIAKYAKAADGDAATLDGFADSSAVSDWARGTMAWAVESGLVNGEPTNEGTMLRPTSDIMRERAAGVLSNAIDLKILG